MSSAIFSLLTVFALAASASAATLLSPGDAILGGVLNGANFEVGTIGTTGGANNWPGPEPPEDLINGLIGGGGEKYLNFARENTGFIVTPAASTGGLPTLISSMELWVANDTVARDPASYALYGTNEAISGGGPFPLSDFTLISSGALALPDGRNTVTGTSGLSEVVNINAAEAFTAYMVVFPTVKDNTTNSMQLSEIQFDGTVVPEPSSSLLLALGGWALLLRRRRR